MKNSDNNKKINKKTKYKKKLDLPSFLDSLRNLSPFVHLIIIAVLIIILFLIIFLSKPEENPVYREIKEAVENKKALRLKYNVYGDHFVNDLDIDKNKSNLYFDLTTTAYMYPPDYRWLDKGSCQDKYCGEEAVNWHYAGADANEEIKYCRQNNCLSLKNNEIFYNNKTVALPSNIAKQEIRNISIYPLENTWLVGFVFADGGEEKGRAYSFNGNKYIDLDPEDKFPFVSLSDFQGASFGFGGDSDNYLVLYGGYKFLGYQVKDGKKFDISRFFGLRVSSGGFYPLAIKSEREGDTIWHVCSLNAREPRLIKLWQNGSDSIKGSLSLTLPILEEKEKVASAYCQAGEKSGELELVIERGGRYYKRVFEDYGFKQGDKYILASSNILKVPGVINEAKFYQILACDSEACDNTKSNDLTFLVSGDGSNYFPLKFKQAIKFPSNPPGLYWQIEANASKETVNYSPWIDAITNVSYSWFE